jgi:hypothetical protein
MLCSFITTVYSYLQKFMSAVSFFIHQMAPSQFLSWIRTIVLQLSQITTSSVFRYRINFQEIIPSKYKTTVRGSTYPSNSKNRDLIVTFPCIEFQLEEGQIYESGKKPLHKTVSE